MQNSVPRIVPITDLRKTSEISALCHDTNGPVYITKNGYSDLVIMTVEAYERELFMHEVAVKLSEAEEQLQAGVKRTPLEDVIARQRKKLHEEV